MAIAPKTYSPYVVVPKLPSAPKQNNDPSAYYTKALGFLPIDTRYMVNPTNSFAYNSVADIAFNKAAWEKRWGDSEHSWLNTWYGYIPRTIADTALLIKDTIYDPIAQGITEDNWRGFMRGGSTALMNSLVNLGNTLDVVANPIKGLVLEGGDGFVKGLFGDENGRKQYDYINYIDTGNGVGNFVTSLALELVSDPLNWFSWGGKALVSGGAKALSNAAADAVTNSLKTMLKKGITSLDDLADGLADTTKYLTKDTAKATLEALADESGKLTAKAVDDFGESLKPLLKKTITRAQTEFGGSVKGYNEIAHDLTQGKSSRFKASTVTEGPEIIPPAQVVASQYLSGIAKKLPDILPSSMGRIAAGTAAYRSAENIFKGLRYAAGATGLDEIILMHKLGSKTAGSIRNEIALRDPNIIKTIGDLEKELNVETVEKAIETLGDTVDAAATKELLAELYIIKDTFTSALFSIPHSGKGYVSKIKSIQKDFITQVDALIKKLNINDVSDYTAYIKYIEDSNVVLKNSEVAQLIDELHTVNKLLTEDFSNPSVRAHYKKTVEALHYKYNQEQRTVEQQIRTSQKEFYEWQEKYGVEYNKALEQSADDTTAAIDALTKIDKATGLDMLGVLNKKIIPNTIDALKANDIFKNTPNALKETLDSFEELVEEFRKNLKNFETNETDFVFRENLVKSYNDLVERLQSFRKFETPEGGTNISNASGVYNKLGEANLNNRTKHNTAYEPTKQDKVVLKKAKAIEESLATDAEYAGLRNYYTAQLKADPYYFAKEYERGMADKAIVSESAISKAVDSEIEAYVNSKYNTDDYVAFGQTPVDILNKAKELRVLTAQSPVTDFKLKELSLAIEDLKTFSIKPISSIIDPADVSKYKLVIYSIMNRTAAVVHRLMGIAADGSSTINRTVTSVVVTPSVIDAVFKNKHVGTFFKHLQNKKLLPKVYEASPDTLNALVNFAIGIKYRAREFLGANHLHTTAENYIKNYSWMDLEAFAKDNKAFKKAYTEYTKVLNEYELARLNQLEDFILIDALDNAAHNLKTVLDEQVGLATAGNSTKYIKTTHPNVLSRQAQTVLKMSDDDIAAFAKFDYKEIYNYPEAHLAKLIDEYSDTTSGLYKFLNNPDNVNNPMYGATIEASKKLIERLRSYKALVTEISNLAKANGLEGFYIEGLLDAFVTQLSKRIDLDYYPVDKVVNDLLTGTNLYVRNLYDAPSTSMESVLGQVVNNLSKNTELPQEAKLLVERIRSRLKLGKAHSAVVDVDNLIDLIQLSKYTDDVRLKDLLTKLTTDAKGKRRVVFDIESTGANEAAAHIFQISGKVLDENNLPIKDSEFNYIIKPPKGYKPTHNVLKDLAQEADPEKWWTDNIVNAKNIPGVQVVFENIEDALAEFMKHCNKQGTVVLVGHNIKGYDLAALSKHSNTLKTFLNEVDKFDTLEHMNSNVMFQLTGAQEQAFKNELKNIFTKAVAENNPALSNKPFQYVDLKTLSELKQALKDDTLGFSQGLTKSDLNALAAREYGGVTIDDVTGKTKGKLSGVQLETSGSVDELEKIINGVIDEWRSPTEIKGSNFFIVSKLNPDSLEEQIQNYLKEFAHSGLLKEYDGVAPGKNIVQYFSGNVSKESVLINPVRVISYEIEDIFDLKKALNVYKVVDKDNALGVTDLARLTKQAIHIQRIRNWLPKDYIDLVVLDARTFLKKIEPYQSFAKVLYDDMDNITAVAAAIYAYKLLKEHPPVGLLNTSKYSDEALAAYKQFNSVLEEYKHFGNVTETINGIRGKTNLTSSTPLLYQLDSNCGVPRAIFENDWYTYDKFVDVLRKDMVFDDIREYRVGRNLFNLHDAAKHALLEPISKLAKEIETYLKGLGAKREVIELAIKRYNNYLDYAGINNILTRANRTDALANEAFVRGGYVCFETNSKIDLSDFKADKRFVIVDNAYSSNGRYIHIIAATRETFEAAKDINLPAITIKGVADIDDTMFGFLKRIRDYAADKLVKNLEYSRGDVITTDAIDYIQDTLRRLGVSDDVIKTLPDTDVLNTPLKNAMGEIERPAFFNTSRANISIIGDKSLWSFITNETDTFQIVDPFKQIVRTVWNANAERTSLIHYCSLLLNEHSNIKTANVFKDLKPEELYKLLKDNNDFVMVYITKSGYLNRTKSGLIVKEFDLVNPNSIVRARKLDGVHIIPRTEAIQLMKAVNEFELPPIAKIAKAISDVYKVAYLGSLGFIIRNIIDSNYKTYASLNGQVSLPKSINHFIQSLSIVRKHADVGKEYTKAMGRYFKTDLEYDVFYKYCHSFGNEEAIQKIIIDAPSKVQNRVAHILKEFSKNEKLNSDLIKKVKPNLIKTEMFSIVDAFINHGPSAGLSKTILQNLPGASKAYDELGALDKFNKWITQDTPARFVYGANDYIEQAARLSMFLQRLELGDTIDEANKAIIKSHFDYSDKTIGMLYTEILFPFMSFSYKNLNFWVEMMYSNPMLVGQMEHIFRTILDYQGLFEPDQGAYESYDYTFDWSKDVNSFEANAPWTMINAARLYHILNGNILIKHGDTVKHDAGYGEKENELYTVFKLSPSVLDAVKMLYTPLNVYSERLLPPYETMLNIFKGMADGENVVEKMSIASLASSLPYFDMILQRVGRDENYKLRHNNIYQRIKDAGVHQVLPSVFGAAYVPIKNNVYYYDSDYNILGGFKTNYYAKKNYSNPYNSKYPTYTLTRMAQNKKPRNIYGTSKTNRIYKQQYNGMIKGISYRSLEHRLKDYNYYY